MHGDRPQPVGAHDAVAGRLQRDEDLLVGVEEGALRSLLGQRAHDLEGDAPDQDLLPDHRVAVGIEQRGDGGADHRHPPPGRIVARGVHAAGRDRVVVYGDVVGRGAYDVHVDVLVALLHLEVVAQLGHHRAHVARVVRERRVVIHGEAHPVAAGDAAHEALAGVHAQQRRPERLNAVLHGLLRTGAERDHRDHGAHADNDAQHGEQRAQLVGPQRFEGDLDDLAQEHRYLGVPLVSTSTVSFSARPDSTSM